MLRNRLETYAWVHEHERHRINQAIGQYGDLTPNNGPLTVSDNVIRGRLSFVLILPPNAASVDLFSVDVTTEALF